MRLFTCLTIFTFGLLSVYPANAQSNEVNIQAPGVNIKTGADGGVIVQAPGVDIQTNGSSSTTTTRSRVQTNRVVTSAPSQPAGQSFNNTKLQNMNWSGKTLANASFSNSELTNVSFEGSNLRNARFTNIKCQNCNFRGADLTGANFSNAMLENSDFRGAIVVGADFSNADFKGSKINGVDFSQSDISNASFDNADYSSTYTVTSTTIAQQLTQAPSGSGKQYHQTPSINLAIHFATGSDNLESDAWQQLSELSKALNSETLKNANILIEGHTDSVGKDDYNVDLSYRRAAKVMQTLSTQLGVAASRLTIKGYGETRPVADNNNDFGRAQNRRVTIVNLSSK